MKKELKQAKDATGYEYYDIAMYYKGIRKNKQQRNRSNSKRKVFKVTRDRDL